MALRATDGDEKLAKAEFHSSVAHEAVDPRCQVFDAASQGGRVTLQE
jgi:hypothetical protein